VEERPFVRNQVVGVEEAARFRQRGHARRK
jgi:hypothetical protein